MIANSAQVVSAQTVPAALPTAPQPAAVVVPAEAAPGIAGEVLTAGKPVGAAQVYAYEVGSSALKKVLSDAAGRFLFAALPAGIYKIIAFKQGFTPAVELLLRRRPEVQQSVQLLLHQESTGDVRQAEDYWTVRGRIPADVLRDIQQFEVRAAHVPKSGRALDLSGASAFQAEMTASGGVENLGAGYGEAQLASAQVGVQGAMGKVTVGIDGRYQQLQGTTVPAGEMHAVAVRLDGLQDSSLQFATASGQAVNLQPDGMLPVDLDHYRLIWSGQAGANAQSTISARYTAENNYYQPGWIDPMAIPGSSRTLDIEGSYRRAWGERGSIEAGLLYRQRDSELRDLAFGKVDGEERIGVFGLAGMQVEPRVYVEYGVYSTAQDGGLSLMPHGGMVVQLGSGWQARTAISQRLDPGDATASDRGFTSAQVNDSKACQQSGEACYELSFARSLEGDNSIKIGALHRKYAETLRLYFSDDFFERLESLFLVRGDSLPELQLQIVRRIAPKVLAKIESNLAAGGGGIFYATDAQSYENQVRYLVTSIDTQFQQTSTGVFVAFHHLEQALHPIASQTVQGEFPAIEMQRLQLMLTQDLNILADLSSKWAFRLNMELSRGSTPYTLTADDELYKKLTGGFSVSF